MLDYAEYIFNIANKIIYLLNNFIFSAQPTNNFLQSYQNYQRTSIDSRLIIFLLFLLIAFVLIVFGIVLIRRINQTKIVARTKEFRQQSFNHLKNHAVSKLNSLSLSEDQKLIFFEMIGNTDNYIAVISNASLFEQYLADYKMIEASPIKIKLAESLREKFNFDFNNLEIEFSHTRMLPIKKKVRVFLRRGFKKVDFLSAIVDNSYNNFAILPPKFKGNWVRIDDLKDLEIRVLRENDSEYQFFCKIKTQNNDAPIPQVILFHTDNIAKISTRAHARYNLSIPCRISRFSDNSLKASDYIDVRTRDISEGGMCLIIPKDVLIVVDDILEIDMINSKLNSIFGKVIANNRLSNSEHAHLNIEFTGISDIERLLLSRYIKQLVDNKSNVAS